MQSRCSVQPPIGIFSKSVNGKIDTNVLNDEPWITSFIVCDGFWPQENALEMQI